jgi:hypothetical protein
MPKREKERNDTGDTTGRKKTRSEPSPPVQVDMKSEDSEEVDEDNVAQVFKDAYKTRADVIGFDGHMEDAPDEFVDWKTWVPVHDFRSRRSPQSHAACKAMGAFYNGIDNAWVAGWRWMITKHNHQWFPPQWVYDAEPGTDLAITLKKYRRNGRDNGSIQSTDVVRILLEMQKVM